MLRVIVVGLGPIGFACARAVRAERGVKLVGMVDVDPSKVGKTLVELGGLGDDAEPLDQHGQEPRVVGTIAEAAAHGADVAILTTTSKFDSCVESIRDLLKHGMAVVSSCEQMVWPWYRNADLANQIDAEARRAGRALLGTGVNPGFVMDKLAIVLATMVRRVTGVRCIRRVDASVRRQPLQAKIGATMSVEQFNSLKAADKIGHRGLAESIALLAAGLGREVRPGSIIETLEPVIAAIPIPSALGLISPGSVAGIHNVGRWQCDDLKIELDLTMAVGLDDPKDVVELSGPVQLKCKIPGAIPGDSATVAALLNHIPVVHRAKPGLRTMIDIEPAGCHNLDFVRAAAND